MYVVFYTVKIMFVYYVLLHILLSLWHTVDPRNVCMCMYWNIKYYGYVDSKLVQAVFASGM